MAFCNQKCTAKCINSHCCCNLPIYLMYHIQLPCCKDSLHHIDCIVNKSKCPNCKIKFEQDTKTYINNVKTVVYEKLKEIETRKQKQNLLRKNIQLEVNKMIKERNRKFLEYKKMKMI